MYHFVWADQREKQGYKSDVSLRGGIQIICALENDATLYRHNKATIDCGFEFVNNIESVTLNLVTKCFLTREPLLIVGLNLLMMLSLNLNFVINCFLMGAWFIIEFEDHSPAGPKDYIYSVACEV